MTEPQAATGSSFLDRLGDRGLRRAEPRTSISLAGAGCALGILGVLVLAADTGLDDGTGEFNQVPGILLSAIVVALGYFVLTATREGPIATAGTVAAVLGVPAFMFFVTFDEDSFPPYNTEAILLVSAAVWLGSYLIGPATGRPFFLGAGLIGVWFTVLEVTENLFESPFRATSIFFDRTSSFETIDPETGEAISTGGGVDRAFDAPDVATIGMLSLGLGVAFLLLAWVLDRDRRHGTATPFTFAAIPCLAVGVAGLADDLEAAGSGLLLTVIGLALAWHGATAWRRATSWIGGATVALGLAIFLGDMADDDPTTGGMLFIAGGIAMIFGAHLLVTVLNEADELAITNRAAGRDEPVRVVVPDDEVPAAPDAPVPPPDDPDAEWKPPPPTA